MYPRPHLFSCKFTSKYPVSNRSPQSIPKAWNRNAFVVMADQLKRYFNLDFARQSIGSLVNILELSVSYTDLVESVGHDAGHGDEVPSWSESSCGHVTLFITFLAPKIKVVLLTNLVLNGAIPAGGR